MSGVDHADGGDCVLFWWIRARQPVFDEQRINGTRGWWDAVHYISQDSLVAQLEKLGKEPGLNTWVAMATVTLGARLEEKTVRGIEWRRREWRETHQKKNRRGGGLKTEDGKAYRAIFLFASSPELRRWRSVPGFLRMALFVEEEHSVLYVKAGGSWLKFNPPAPLWQSVQIYPPRVDTSHAARSARQPRTCSAFLAARLSHLCVWAICCFNGEEAFFVGLVSPSQILIWMTIRAWKW